jgi:alkanesulfonate monooxygenase SsuD/methylene tetrahydromethanopterin reductase-like flavin-dependent oxidoreductase (luciferase family)
MTTPEEPRRFPKIGVMYDFRLPDRPDEQRSWADFADATLTTARELDALGVDGLWLTEHHFISDGYLPALMPMAAALAATTSHCDIGTSVLLAPLQHPVALAEAAAVVDNLSRGRLILGLGLGYRGDELAAFGVRKQERARRMEETLQVLFQAWGPDKLAGGGEFVDLPAVEVHPKPVQQPIRLWLGARSEPAARRAGRYAAGVIIGQDTELRHTFRDTAQAQGRDTAGLEIAQIRSTVVPELIGTDHLDQVSAGLEWRSSRYQDWYSTAADLPQDRQFVSPGTATESAIRTLDEELQQLAELAAAGVTYVIYHGTAPGVDPAVYLPLWSRLISETR